MILLLVVAGGFGARGAASAPADASTTVAVVDPIDGWMGAPASIDGDFDLARVAVGSGITVSRTADSLRFEASGQGVVQAKRRLGIALDSYERARAELQQNLDERLALLPDLAQFVETRIAAIESRVNELNARLVNPQNGATPMLRAARAAAIASALDFESRGRELLVMAETTLAPAWESTPVGDRLDRLDELLADAYWFAAGENVEALDSSR